jgi:hypothetical protein
LRDVRVLELCRELRFVDERPDEAGILGAFGEQALQCDLRAQARGSDELGAMNLRHAAFA